MAEPAFLDVSSADRLTDAELLELLVESGAVVLRGLAPVDEPFDQLTDRFMNRLTCDPGKVVIGQMRGASGQAGRAARLAARTVARVTKRMVGGDSGAAPRYAPFSGFGINPHTENAFLPDAQPELVWFQCRQPAPEGGDSILADGADALSRLDPDTERWIRSTSIRYVSTLTEPQWRSVWNETDHDALVTRLRAIEGVSASAEAGEVTVTYDSVQVRPTLFGGREAIQTNMMSRQPFDSIGENHKEVTATGDRVERDTLLRLLAATRPANHVRLEAGDILVIDNTRVMHGRTPFESTDRRVITRCGWLRPELAPA